MKWIELFLLVFVGLCKVLRVTVVVLDSFLDQCLDCWCELIEVWVCAVCLALVAKF